MRLGVVLMGLGAHAAASAGALEWMLDAGVRPYALCGMQSAAWASALYLADTTRGESKPPLCGCLSGKKAFAGAAFRAEAAGGKDGCSSVPDGVWKSCCWLSWASA